MINLRPKSKIIDEDDTSMEKQQILENEERILGRNKNLSSVSFDGPRGQQERKAVRV